MSAPYPYRPRGPLSLTERLRESALFFQLLWPLALVGAVFVAFLVAFVLSDPAHGNGTGEVPAQTFGGSGGAAGVALVASEPFGATVYLNGDSVGVTPVRLADLPPGPHRLALWLDGFVRADTLVRLAAGERADVRLRLRAATPGPPAAEPAPLEAAAPPPAPLAGLPPAEPAPEPPPAAERPQPARLEVLVRPWGTVTVDGTVRRRDTDVLVAESVEPGTRVVRVVHPVLGDVERTVRVAPGQTARLVFDLNAGTVSADAP